MREISGYKKRIMACVFLGVGVFTGFVKAELKGVHIISQTHCVGVEANGDLNDADDKLCYPEDAVMLPITISGDSDWWEGYHADLVAKADYFEISAESDAPSLIPDNPSNYWYSRAWANSEYVFSPENSFLSFDYRACGSFPWEWNGRFELYDITDPDQTILIDKLFHWQFPEWPDEELISRDYSLDISRIYSLRMNLEAYSDDTTDGLCRGTLKVDSIPEPASLCLVTLGLVRLFRRKEQS